jgi:hypothetical protein
MAKLEIFTVWFAVTVCVSGVYGAQSLTVNGQAVDSVTLYLDQPCTVEVVSSDSSSYSDCLGFDYCLSLGELSHLETKPEAGDIAQMYSYTDANFCGYRVMGMALFGSPSPGVHFVFEYVPRRVGQVEIKLYDGMLTTQYDSVTVTIIPAAMTTSFTYQGRLIDYNDAADGFYDFQFRLYDAATDGNQVGDDVNAPDVDVVDGYFTAQLDFGGDVFLGEDRWLEVGVRPGDLSDPNIYTSLSPRQQLTPAPMAAVAREAAYCENAVSGGGSTGYIPKFVDSAVLGDSGMYESGGKVGIWTDNPYGTLQIHSPDYQLVLHGTDAAANEKNWIFGADEYGLTLSGVSDDFSAWSGIFHVERDGPAAVRTIFPCPGKFGIGEAYPDAMLTVSASGGADDLLMLSSDDNRDGDLLIVKNSGNVGIGIKTPARKLHVSDVIRLEPRATAPADPAEGDMYMDSGTHKLMVYDGSAWRACW